MGKKPQVLFTSAEEAWHALEKLDGLDLANTPEPPRKKQCHTPTLTSTSVLERLIHAEPCANVMMNRIPDVVRKEMGKYQVDAEDREVPWAGLEFLDGPEAARERALRRIPGYKILGEFEKHPAHMAQYHLGEV